MEKEVAVLEMTKNNAAMATVQINELKPQTDAKSTAHTH